MSNVNEKLQALKVKEQEAIDYCNIKLSAKGVTEQATSVVDIGNKIESIQSGNPYQILQDKFFYSERTNYQYAFINSRITYDDLSNLVLDTSSGTNYNFSYMFYGCENLSKTPPLDTSKGKSFFYMFGYCKNLKTISQLDLSNATSNTYIFDGCYALENISFVAESIKISIKFLENPKLTDESIQSIIDGLADLTGQKAQTITFHKTVKNKLTEEQIASATSKNWNIA